MATEIGGSLHLDFRVRLGARVLEAVLDTDSQSVAVFGPSGGGKSTLLRVLAGAEKRACFGKGEFIGNERKRLSRRQHVFRIAAG